MRDVAAGVARETGRRVERRQADRLVETAALRLGAGGRRPRPAAVAR